MRTARFSGSEGNNIRQKSNTWIANLAKTMRFGQGQMSVRGKWCFPIEIKPTLSCYKSNIIEGHIYYFIDTER